MCFDQSTKNQLVKQCVQRIVQLEPVISSCINRIDLGVSNIYDRDDVIKTASILSNSLGQMDSDLVSLIELLDD